MLKTPFALLVALSALTVAPVALAADGNRLTYLDHVDPYYPSRTFPKLTTPQWVGEEGVEAVIVLAIDDMRGHEKWESYLRPILERLKRIDGRAPVSIMTNVIDPKDPHLQQWLKEGLSLEVHTIDHPCPILKDNNFEKAKSTYDRCVDLMNAVPGNRPVAFRTPCCDSLNTPSPRFFAEIFNKTTERGHFLTIDSSVFNITTANDPELPRELVLEQDGRERFRKYLPFDSFVNTIEDYPYPYVIGRLCWEFPCAVPSDWEGQNLNKPNSEKTVEDLKAAIDATVIKKGVFNFVFHPHGWIRNTQVVELIDHVAAKHGKKVKFLTFKEAQERLDRHLLAGQPLRDEKGRDNGVRLLDVNGDGYMDVVIGNERLKQTRVWDPAGGKWTAREGWPEGFAVEPQKPDRGVRYVDLNEDGHQDMILSNAERYEVRLSTGSDGGWRTVMSGKRGEKDPKEEVPPIVRADGTNNGVWFHSRHLWVQNEETAKLPNLVDRRHFSELVGKEWPGPKSPEAALRSFRVKPGFEIELVAAEPLVMDPVSLAWGADGKLWVVEMADYPNGVDGKGMPGGRVKFLEDLDGDGKYDKATLFLDGLNCPTGLFPWGKGVIVTVSPDIFYAEDTDGDGRADKRENLFVGFTPGNQQHRVNGPTYGLDNWLYYANGHEGGNVRAVKTGQTVSMGSRDLRVKPETGEMEAELGPTQFYRAMDDWGNWFGNDNSSPMYQFVLSDRYLKRNPHFAPPAMRVNVPKIPSVGPVFPVSRTLERFNDPQASNRFTSACSTIVYRDRLLGDPFYGNMFVCEPVHNLVHREVMTQKADGVTFISERGPGEEKSEFVASTDNWFRPASVRTGPDGALWIADMYRQVIEHPQWIPKDWQQKLDLRAGHDKGRIYRVYPVGKRPRAIPRLDKLNTEQLVAALDWPNGWQRDTVQQLIVERKLGEAAPLLKAMATGHANPLARLHALCTLDGLGALDERVLMRAVRDAEPGIRRHGVRLSEPFLGKSEELAAAVATLVEDPEAQVRLQVACSLGQWDDERAGAALARLAVKDAGHTYIAAAVMTSVNARNLNAIVGAVTKDAATPPPPGVLANLVRVAAAMNDAKAIGTALGAAARGASGDEPGKLAELADLLSTLDQAKKPLGSLAKETPEGTREAVGAVEAVIDRARGVAVDAAAPLERRVAAARLLGRGVSRQEQDVKVLAGLLTPQTPPELQAAAVANLGQRRDAGAARILLGSFKAFGPALRGQVLDLFLNRADWLETLLQAAEKGQLLPADFDATRRQRLLQHRLAKVRERAEKVFAAAVNPDRLRVFEQFKAALTLTGNAQKGAEVFAKTCSTCHQLGGVGHDVGPALSAMTGKSADWLLTAILDPNRAVETRYADYVADTKSGMTLNGILIGETGSSVTLLAANGQRHEILRSDLVKLRSTGMSLMPEGLESGYGPQDLADLIAFIQSNQPARQRKVIAGNEPRVIQPGDRGLLRLTANDCEIYGPTLILEKQFNNLGFWQSEEDQAVWTVEVPEDGPYRVWLEWACAADSAGNAYVIEFAGGEKVASKVGSTGTWDAYRKGQVGVVNLKKGRQQVIVRSEGKPRGALMDLKEVQMAPPNKY